MRDSRPVLIEKPSFDELAKLAHSDPEGFEALRRRILESHIAASPEEQKLKLERMQFRINGVLRRSSNPVHACILLQNMMVENTTRISDALSGLQQGLGLLKEASTRCVAPFVVPDGSRL
mgnify:CR=1 FL=1